MVTTKAVRGCAVACLALALIQPAAADEADDTPEFKITASYGGPVIRPDDYRFPNFSPADVKGEVEASVEFSVWAFAYRRFRTSDGGGDGDGFDATYSHDACFLALDCSLKVSVDDTDEETYTSVSGRLKNAIMLPDGWFADEINLELGGKTSTSSTSDTVWSVGLALPVDLPSDLSLKLGAGLGYSVEAHNTEPNWETSLIWAITKKLEGTVSYTGSTIMDRNGDFSDVERKVSFEISYTFN